MKEKIILVGTGQHFNVVLYNLREQDKYEVACAIDGNPENRGKTINGVYIDEIYEDLDALKEKYNTNTHSPPPQFGSFGTLGPKLSQGTSLKFADVRTHLRKVF